MELACAAPADPCARLTWSRVQKEGLARSPPLPESSARWSRTVAVARRLRRAMPVLHLSTAGLRRRELRCVWERVNTQAMRERAMCAPRTVVVEIPKVGVLRVEVVRTTLAFRRAPLEPLEL